jgi:molybdopterin-guanine dinucleotide biosynthesis protein A
MRKRDERPKRVNKFLKESHIVTRLAKEQASFFNINDINDISFFRTPDCHHCYSIA